MCFSRKNAGEATFIKSVTFLSIALLKYERTSKVLELVNPNETQSRLNVVKYTCAFPAATSQNVCCEKGRLSSRVKWTELSLLGDVDQRACGADVDGAVRTLTADEIWKHRHKGLFTTEETHRQYNRNTWMYCPCHLITISTILIFTKNLTDTLNDNVPAQYLGIILHLKSFFRSWKILKH